MINQIQDIFLFLTTGRVSEESIGSNIKLLINLYILKYGFYLLFALLNLFLFDLRIDGNIKGLNRQGFFKDLINFLILAPIIEEIICRFHLNLKLKNITLSLIATCIIFYDQIWFLLFLISYFLILILISSLKKQSNNFIFVYISAFIFGVSHLAYKDLSYSYEDILSYIYIFTPRFLSGLIYSYLFFKKDIYFSIFLHFLWNLFPFIIYQLANSP
ncbi:type II CAAX prenyl endopeptidase Rce1 family protein [Algoriphagus sp.]|uniref:CPBP family glutamic-type intramembrane protease n=1 Tax=Algoriphagus sp. TaxID=1872435 RepID=UPI00391B44F9